MSVVCPSVRRMTLTAQPARWRTVLRHAGTVAAVVLVGFIALIFAVVPANALPADGAEWSMAWHVVGALAALGAGTAMVWRMSHPTVVLVGAALGAVLLPLDPIGPALALRWVIVREQQRTLWWAVPLGVAGIAVPLLRDSARPARWAVLSTTDVTTGDHSQPSLATYIGIAVVIAVIAVASGVVRRSRTAAALAREQVQARDRRAIELQAQLSRQEERELIAREMHDTVAHHLSLVSLHAAALEVTTEDPAVPESARAMRTSAHQALDEMRGLISSLRDSSSGGYIGPRPTLKDLDRLVAETRGAGAWIAASLQIPDSAEPPIAVVRAVYRIVQEALTNAIKHATGSGVGLQVVAAPGTAITVTVVTWLQSATERAAEEPAHDHAGELSTTGAKAGVIGMTERAVAVGGRLTAGPEGDLWVVRAWLPWEAS